MAVGGRDALYPERTPVDCHALFAADVCQIASRESSAKSRSLRRPVLLQGVTAEVNAASTEVKQRVVSTPQDFRILIVG